MIDWLSDCFKQEIYAAYYTTLLLLPLVAMQGIFANNRVSKKWVSVNQVKIGAKMQIKFAKQQLSRQCGGLHSAAKQQGRVVSEKARRTLVSTEGRPEQIVDYENRSRTASTGRTFRRRSTIAKITSDIVHVLRLRRKPSCRWARCVLQRRA